MRELKTLYKLAREKLFLKDYFCEYCGLMDFNKYYIRSHIKEIHDESGKEIKMFKCKKCYETITKMEILIHECH